jgi:hypothetical protein
MLHMLIMRHTAESCPGKPGNEAVHPCLHAMDELLAQQGVRTVGRWADPPAHVNYVVLDAPSAHVILTALMESGISVHTTSEVRPVLSMD